MNEMKCQEACIFYGGVDQEMRKSAARTDEKRWQRIKDAVQRDSKGGPAGKWSAIKAGIATRKYKAQMEAAGKKPYKTARRPTASRNSYVKWLKEDWGTKSGKPSGRTGERFLPRKARDALTAKEYSATSAKKRADTRKGKAVSKQPRKIAAKTARYRK